MRIPTKVVCLWSCLTAFTFIHTAVAQDYPGQPLSGAEDGGGVASADYVGSAVLEDGGQEPYDIAEGFAPLNYQDPAGSVEAAPMIEGYYPPPTAQGYPPPMVQGYPPPMLPPNANYWPQVSPFDEPVMDRTYRQNGIWVNDSIYANRTYSFSLEYLRTEFNRPGTDTIGDPKIGVPSGFSGFQVVNTSVFAHGDDLLSDGIRGKFIMENADSSTMEASIFWVGESEANYHPFDRANPADTSTLRARGFIGLDDGTDAGVAVPFDTDFKLSYKAQAFGADLLWTTMPAYEAVGFRFRPTFGAKYMKVRELFSLHGEDSSLAYLADATGQPIPGTILPNPFGNPAYSSDLTSRTRSDLAGPEVGVRYEIGGKHFLLWGQSRLAVAANHEVIELSGNQIGDGFFTGFPPPTPADPKPAAFNDKRSSTHVSPIFSQDFYFKGKVFKHLPFFNDSPLLANADMLVGYNFVLVGDVARPTKVIDWRVNDPRIDVNRSRWYMQAVTFGLQWEF